MKASLFPYLNGPLDKNTTGIEALITEQLESLEIDQLNLGLYTTRVTAENLRRAIAEAEGTVIRRDIRCSRRGHGVLEPVANVTAVPSSCCTGATTSTVGGDLEPRPYNLLQPERSVEDFHWMSAVAMGGEWDEAILGAGAGSR
jgi:hypothetical protein